VDLIDVDPGSPTHDTIVASPVPVVSGLGGESVIVPGSAYGYAIGTEGLSKIDLATGTVVLSYFNVDHQGALAITPDGLHVLHGRGGLRILNANTLTDEGGIDVGGGLLESLGRIVVTPDGTRAYAEREILPTSELVCIPLR
jgi:hypothetical protein